MFSLNVETNQNNFTIPFLKVNNNEKEVPFFNITSNINPNYFSLSSTPITIGEGSVYSNGSYYDYIQFDAINSVEVGYVGLVQNMAINGLTYSRKQDNLSSTLNKGEFTYDGRTLQFFAFGGTGKVKTIVLTELLTNEIKTLNLSSTPISSNILKLGIIGSISISKNFKNFPTSGLNLVCNAQNIQVVRDYFNNQNTKILICDTPFRVSRYSETILNQSKFELGSYKINVDLESWYVHPLNLEKQLTDYELTSVKNENTGLGFNISGGSTETTKNYIYYNLSKFFSKVQVPLFGTPISIKVSQDELNSFVSSGSSLINTYCPDFSLYPIYSLSSGVELRSWFSGARNHLITDALILDKDRNGVTINTTVTKISKLPTILNWEEPEKDDPNNPRDSNQDQSESDSRYREPQLNWEKPKTVHYTIPSDTTSVTQCPKNIKTIKDLSLNFDFSGETKELQYITNEGSFPLKSTVITYGFAYTALDCTRTNGKLNQEASSKWIPISSISTEYIYDEKTGYLIEERVNGWKLARFAQETDKLETLKVGTVIDMYLFRKIPVRGIKSYLLKTLRGKYKDLEGADKYLTWFSRNPITGKAYAKAKVNPTYVEPMYIAQSMEYFNSFASMENPKNFGRSGDTKKEPDLTTGEERKVETIVTINQSKSTTDSIEYREIPDSYTTYTTTFSAQDDRFKNSLAITQSSYTEGRPSQASVKPNGWSINKDGEPILKTVKKPNEYNAVNTSGNLSIDNSFIIYTAPYNPTSIREPGNIFYKVPSLHQALMAANYELQEQKTFNESTLSLTTFFNNSFVEGDFVDVYWSNNYYKCRINTINHEIEIQDSETFTGITQLSLGIVSTETYLTYYKGVDSNPDSSSDTPENEKTEEELLKDLNLFLPLDKDYQIGSLGEVDNFMDTISNRGNY